MTARAWARRAAGVLLLAPAAAWADPITLTVLLAPYIGGALAAFVASNVLTLGFVAISAFGSVQSRRKARSAAARARAEANSRLEDRSATVLQAVPPWRVVYGRAIVGGDIVAIFASDKTGYRENGSTYVKPDALKHLVIVVAAHEVQAINEVYIDGVALGALDAEGWVTSGEFFAAGRPDTRSVFIAAGASRTVPEPVVSVLHAYYTTGVGVDIAYTDVTPTLNGARTIITNPNATNGIDVDYTIAHDSTKKASVRVSKHLGSASQTVDTYLAGVVPTQWTSAHRLRGLAYVVVTLDLEEPRFQGGPPMMTFDVSGKKVLDTRTGTTAWSRNPALIVRDWLTSPWGYEVDAADVDVPACNAAANACDALISLTVGGVTTPNQATYACDGAFSSADGREAVLEDIVESMAGFASYGATWRIVAGVWTVPVLSLTDDDLDGQIDIVQAGAGMGDIFNGVRGSYIGADRATPTDFDAYQNSTFVSADGRELWRDITLPFTNNRARARNLCRVFVERNRDSLMIRYPAKLRAWPLEIGDRVRITSAEYGFSSKTFRVTDWQFGTSSAVQLTLQEDAAAIYDLADAASADPSPNTGLPNPWSVGEILGLAALSDSTTLQISAGSAIVPRVLVSWSPVTDAYVADGSGRIEVLWRRPAGPWQQVNVPGDSTSVYLVGPNHGDRIVIEARARNGLGAVGPSSFLSHTVSGAAQVTWGAVDGDGKPADNATSDLMLVLDGAGMERTGNTLTRVSGGGAWDAGARGVEFCYAGAFVSAFPGTTNKNLMFGMSTDPAIDANYTSIDYAWYVKADGTLESRWSGANISTHGAYTTATSLAITYDNAEIKWLKDGVLVRSKTVGAGLAMAFDSSFNSTGAKLTGIRFAPFGAKGTDGAPGRQSTMATVYRWDTGSVPSGPTGSATWTWATSSFGSAPAGWTLTPGTSPAPGLTLWAAAVQVTAVATDTTTAFNWTVGVSITARGYAGTDGGAGIDGNSARYCYQRVPGNPAPTSGFVTTSGSSSFPTSAQSNATWGINQAWVGSDPSPSSTNTLYQADGIYSPATGNTVWGTPYISSLKVGSLSAISANMGSLTSGTITLDSSGHIKGGQTAYDTGTGFFLGYSGAAYKFSIGSAAKAFLFDGSTPSMRGAIVGTGNLFSASVIDVVNGNVTTSARSTTSTGERTTTRTIGSIVTSSAGDGRVQVTVSANANSSVTDFTNYGLLAEATVTTNYHYCTLRFRLKRGSTVLREFGFTDRYIASSATATQFMFPLTFFDTPGAGVTATYSIEIYSRTGTAAGLTDVTTSHAHEVVDFAYILAELKK